MPSAAKSIRIHYQSKPKVFVNVSVIRGCIRIIARMRSIGFYFLQEMDVPKDSKYCLSAKLDPEVRKGAFLKTAERANFLHAQNEAQEGTRMSGRPSVLGGGGGQNDLRVVWGRVADREGLLTIVQEKFRSAKEKVLLLCMTGRAAGSERDHLFILFFLVNL